MNINIICVGKIKEKYFTEAINEYSKRLSKYCTFKIIEVNDFGLKENASEAEVNKVKHDEGQLIMSKIKPSDFIVALTIDGKSFDSEGFSKYLSDLFVHQVSDIDFIIGGSLGLSDEVIKRADIKLSFSKMTFPHQLMRVILSEQIYRAFRIMRNEPYHK